MDASHTTNDILVESRRQRQEAEQLNQWRNWRECCL